MSDSQPSDRLAAKHERIRRERYEGIKRWVEYVREHPPDVWGPQQNAVVNEQLESARASGRSVAQEQRVRAFAEDVVTSEADEATNDDDRR